MKNFIASSIFFLILLTTLPIAQADIIITETLSAKVNITSLLKQHQETIDSFQQDKAFYISQVIELEQQYNKGVLNPSNFDAVNKQSPIFWLANRDQQKSDFIVKLDTSKKDIHDYEDLKKYLAPYLPDTEALEIDGDYFFLQKYIQGGLSVSEYLDRTNELPKWFIIQIEDFINRYEILRKETTKVIDLASLTYDNLLVDMKAQRLYLIDYGLINLLDGLDEVSPDILKELTLFFESDQLQNKTTEDIWKALYSIYYLPDTLTKDYSLMDYDSFIKNIFSKEEAETDLFLELLEYVPTDILEKDAHFFEPDQSQSKATEKHSAMHEEKISQKKLLTRYTFLQFKKGFLEFLDYFPRANEKTQWLVEIENALKQYNQTNYQSFYLESA